MASSPRNDDEKSWLSLLKPADWLATITVVTVVLVVFGVHLAKEHRELRSNWQAQLDSLAQSQAELVIRWADERLSDLRFIASSPQILSSIKHPRTAGATAALADQLSRHAAAHGYPGICLNDPAGRLVVASAGASGLCEQARQATPLAARYGDLRLALLPLSAEQFLLGVSLSILPPTRASRQPASLGTLSIWVSAQADLFPSLRNTPLPSRTGETVLVFRQEGEHGLLSIIPLGGKPYAERLLRLPSGTQPLAAAALGETRTFVPSQDLRGVKVLASTYPLPGGGWGLVSKVDSEEAAVGFRHTAAAHALVALIVLSAISSLLLAQFHKRRGELLSSEMRYHGSNEELQDTLRRQAALNEMLQISLMPLLLPQKLTKLLENILATPWFEIERKGCVMVREATGLAMTAQVGMSETLKTACTNLPLGRCLCGQVAQTGHELITSSLDERHEVSYEGIQDHGHMCLPLKAGDETIGALNLYLRAGAAPSERQKDFARAAADIVAGVVLLAKSEERFLQAQKMEAVGRLAGGVAHDFNNILTAIQGYATFVASDLKTDDTLRDDVPPAPGLQPPPGPLPAEPRPQRGRRRHGQVAPTPPRHGHPARDQARAEPCSDLRRPGTDGAGPHEPGRQRPRRHARRRNAGGRDDDRARGSGGKRRHAHRLGHRRGDGTRADRTHLRAFLHDQAERQGDRPGSLHGLRHRQAERRRHRGVKHPGPRDRLQHLPASSQPLAAEEPAPAATPPVPSGTETVLLVEDDANIRTLSNKILSRAGYQVLSAADAEQALEVLKRHEGRVDLLLTDIVMPGMSGPYLAKTVLSARPGMKVLFISGNEEGIMAGNGILQSGRLLLHKPFLPDALVRKVRTLLDETAPGR